MPQSSEQHHVVVLYVGSFRILCRSEPFRSIVDSGLWRYGMHRHRCYLQQAPFGVWDVSLPNRMAIFGECHGCAVQLRLPRGSWVVMYMMKARARAPTYRCPLFSTNHHVNCLNCPLRIHLAVQICVHFQRFLGILQT